MFLNGAFSWDQTLDTIEVLIPLKGAAINSVDIYASSLYIKINYKPYLLHLDLYEKIDYSSGFAKVENSSNGTTAGKLLKLKFKKQVLELWPELVKNFDDIPAEEKKKVIKQRRDESIKEKEIALEQLKEKSKDRRIQDERHTTREQMALDQRERDVLEEKKMKEKQQAESEVYETFQKLATAEVKTRKKLEKKNITKPKKVSFAEEPLKDKNSVSGVCVKESQDEQRETHVADMNKQAVTNIFDDKDIIVTVANSENNVTTKPETSAEEEEITYVPEPRQVQKLKLKFTPRIFPSPMRESKREEEEDWLLRNRRHLNKQQQKRLEGVDISERDPYWLKGKGDDFFKKGDFASAINAYTCAIEVDNAFAAAFSNRAACYLKLDKYDECVHDCTTAITILQEERNEQLKAAQGEGLPPPKELRRDRVLRKNVLIRRGTAYCAAQKYTKGLADYQKASEEDPNNEQLKSDCLRISILVQCEAFKDLGDTSFREGKSAEAIKCYNQALDLDPGHVSCLSNRAACHLSNKDYELAIKDCSNALYLLGYDENQADEHLQNPDLQPGGHIPVTGSEKWSKWVTALLVRRAASYSAKELLQKAINDSQAAFELNPQSKPIAKTLLKYRLRLENNP